MGNKPSIESAKREITDRHPPRAQFPAFKHNDQAMQNHVKNLKTTLNLVPNMIDKFSSFAGGPAGLGTAFKTFISLIHDSPEAIEKALMWLKVDHMIAKSAHSFVKAEMESLERELILFQDTERPLEDRKMRLAIADKACHELLVKFADTGFYLHKYPFAFAPLLASFVPVFITITYASYRLTPTAIQRQDVITNTRKLISVIRHFRDETIAARLDYIRVDCFNDMADSAVYDLFTEPVDDELFYALPWHRAAYGPICEWYREQTKEKYEDYFKPLLRVAEEELRKIE